MALQINKAITTKNGFPVASGSYVWLHIVLGADKQYIVEVKCWFFKNKAAFDAGNSKFIPAEIEIPENKQSYRVPMTAQDFASVSAMIAHQYVQDQLNQVLGANMVTIVE